MPAAGRPPALQALRALVPEALKASVWVPTVPGSGRVLPFGREAG